MELILHSHANKLSFSQERLCTWPHFESEGFWNSEVHGLLRLVWKRDAVNWEAFMPNSSKDDSGKSQCCTFFFFRISAFSMLSSTFMRRVFTQSSLTFLTLNKFSWLWRLYLKTANCQLRVDSSHGWRGIYILALVLGLTFASLVYVVDRILAIALLIWLD